MQKTIWHASGRQRALGLIFINKIELFKGIFWLGLKMQEGLAFDRIESFLSNFRSIVRYRTFSGFFVHFQVFSFFNSIFYEDVTPNWKKLSIASKARYLCIFKSNRKIRLDKCVFFIRISVKKSKCTINAYWQFPMKCYGLIKLIVAI